MPAGRDGNLKIGDSDIDALNFGTGEVTDVYLGDKHVWTNGSLLLCLQNNTANEIAILGYTNGVRNNRHDVPSSVLRTTHDFAWDGESVLSLNRSDNNVFGYTNGVRDSSKDISTSVLHSNSISGWHLAWDGESVLIFDSTHALLPNVQDSISVYGFTNGARDTSKDISSFVINAALEDGGTNTHHFGLTWDGESLLLLHRSGTVRKVMDSRTAHATPARIFPLRS